MGLFSRRRDTASASTNAPSPSEARAATLTHLKDFVATRRGVEAFVEPATTQTQTTLLLIASTGEWTRRRVPDAKAAWEVAKSLGIPCYDVNFVGYPQRMRDWDANRRAK